MIVVSDSTVFMHLAAMNGVELLHDLFGEIYIPEEVHEEVVVRGADRPGAMEMAGAEWVRRRQAGNTLAVSVLQTHLGAGEAACIVLAREMQADLVILDDRPARLQAQEQGLKITGTIGILLVAAERGHITFLQALDDLLATGFRLHPAEYQRIGDEWKAKQSVSS